MAATSTNGKSSLSTSTGGLGNDPSGHKDTSKILLDLRKLMTDRRHVREPLAAYIVPSGDAHNSEYIAKIDSRREYISGFTGSAGTAVVMQTNALMWTDGRYHLQALKEMDSNWTLMKMGLPDVPSHSDWLANNLEPGSYVGANPMLVSSTAWSELSNKLEASGCQLVGVETDLVDLVWAKDANDPQPSRPENNVFPLDISFTGKTWQKKVEELRAELKKGKCEMIIVTNLDEVAYLLNLRGSDIDYNPVFFSYVAVTEKEVVLFLSPGQVSDPLVKSLTAAEEMEESVIIKNYSEIKDFIRGFVDSSSGKIWLGDSASQGLVAVVPKKRREIKVTPIALMKAIKNDVEIKGFEACHARDAAALCEYFAWLEKNVSSGQVTELSGSDELEKFRSQHENFVGLSFTTISSVGPNGAIIHYRPTPETDRTITTEELYLLDSGAQYKDGTTDVTRTIHMGTPSQYEKECFTRVLKGQIAVASCIFPEKIKGNCIDSFARKHLWDIGLDYMHGTGHGVGAFLNVHEGPMGISWRVYPNDPGLREGMILSDEPGYYEDGKFGIRLENLIRIVPAATKHRFRDQQFLTFAPVTVVPIQTKLIDPSLLTSQEVEWLNNYHEICRDRVGPILKELGKKDALEWLYRESQPIG